MRRAVAVILREHVGPIEVKGAVTLGFEDRFRRRVRLTDDAGEAFLLDLPQATHLNDGDALALDQGGVLLVRAAREDVMDVTGQDTRHIARLAWHIGNRHTPLEVLEAGVLRLKYDHVLLHMLEGLGGRVVRGQAPFAPEPGAYDGPGAGQRHGHHRHHEGDEANGHAHSHHG